jgi:hypothetical protein
MASKIDITVEVTHSECVLSVLYIGGKTSRSPPLLPSLTQPPGCSKRDANFATIKRKNYYKPVEGRRKLVQLRLMKGPECTVCSGTGNSSMQQDHPADSDRRVACGTRQVVRLSKTSRTVVQCCYIPYCMPHAAGAASMRLHAPARDIWRRPRGRRARLLAMKTLVHLGSVMHGARFNGQVKSTPLTLYTVYVEAWCRP